ncbi:MAG: hypothetical protein WKF42_10030 [Solirubrobacteraceae bacterium]
MTKQRELHGEIDWTSAGVEHCRLTVWFAEALASEWSDRLEAIVHRLERAGAPWGTIKVMRKRLRVAGVTPGSEDDLRFVLEGAVQQANADFASNEQDGDEQRSGADEAMTAVFRSFADEPDC